MKRFIPAAALLCLLATTGSPQAVDPDVYSSLEYRFIGPDGNRAIAVVGVPGDPSTMLVGAASGGIFRTTDGGLNWEPVFDDHDVSSVSALAMAPSDPRVVWAGTGETFIIRPALAMGNGIFKSTDTGRSWKPMGLEKTGRIARILVDPRDPDTVFACALGHSYAPQAERGVYKTTDGGESWRLVLFVDANTGCSDIAMATDAPDRILVGMWQLQVDPWRLGSGGPGSGVHLSEDGGETWTDLSGSRGLPGGKDDPVGKVAVAVAPSDPHRMYVLAEAASPGFYRSDDAGESWRLVSNDHTLDERAPYYTRFAVDPSDEDRIYFISVRFSLSKDAGESLVDDPPRAGGDTHDMWIDPTDPGRFMVADDGGMTVTLNRGRSFKRHVLPIAQMYHVATDDQIPYNVYGNRQDGYSYRGPSNSRMSGIPVGLWRDFGGCESGWGIPDPVDDNVIWSGCYDGGLQRHDLRSHQSRDVRIWPEASYGWTPKDVRYRWHWSFPLTISPHDHERIYAGSQHVHVTTDGGQSWQVISPDLTLDEEDHQQDSPGGGLTVDNLYTFDGSVLYAIAESPVQAGVIWTGSNDGQLQLTRDGGQTWTNVTGNIQGLAPGGQISNVEPSRREAGTAYVAIDRHQLGDFDPHVFKTTDFGESFERISDGIPRSPLSFVHVVREDPKRAGMLYVGTDNAVYFSLDDGAHWQRLQEGLPPAPVYWLSVQERFGDLVVATYGRGFYILDDIGPLRALQASVLDSDAHLFAPRHAYRFRPISSIKTGGFGGPAGGSNVTGRNPRYGASLHFYLREETEAEITIEIADQAGEIVRTLEPEAVVGINRVHWDLRHEDPPKPSLRTVPPGKDWVPLGEDGSRPLVTWDLDLRRGQLGPLAAPGEYSVTLVVGEERQSESLVIVKDPHSLGSEADVAAQLELSQELLGDLTRVADMIDRLEWLRRQLLDLEKMVAGRAVAEQLEAVSGEFLPALLEVEGRLFDLQLTGAREDAFRGPMKLYGRLSALASDVGASSADYRPTDQQREVHEVLHERLEQTESQLEELVSGPLSQLDEQLSGLGLGTLTLVPPRDEVS